MDTYALIGHPVEHSLSPRIHQQFAQHTNQTLEYLLIDTPPEHFESQFKRFWTQGGLGLNITLPYKVRAMSHVTHCTTRARQAGAINTVVLRPDGTWLGDNTDGIGLIRDLTLNHQLTLSNKAILLLGAGGAAQGVIAPLLEQHPAHLTLANRTLEKAEQLAKRFNTLGSTVACHYEALAHQSFDLIINATSASLKGVCLPLPDKLLKKGGSCYDMAYHLPKNPFLAWGRAQGAAHCIDGTGMLIEQAAEAFLLWRGIRPDTAPVIRQIYLKV